MLNIGGHPKECRLVLPSRGGLRFVVATSDGSNWSDIPSPDGIAAHCVFFEFYSNDPMVQTVSVFPETIDGSKANFYFPPSTVATLSANYTRVSLVIGELVAYSGVVTKC